MRRAKIVCTVGASTRSAEKIAELARDGKVEGLADLRDESDRQGMRLVSSNAEVGLLVKGGQEVTAAIGAVMGR